MSEYDASILFMPLNEAQLYFNQPNMVTVLEVVLSHPTTSPSSRRISSAPAARASTSRIGASGNATFFTALQVERNVMFLILTLIVLVAAPQHHFGSDHAGEGQGSRHRHPAHHGRHPCRRHAHLLHHRREHRHRRHACRASARRVRLRQYRALARVYRLADQRKLFAPELYYLTQLPAEMDSGETASVVIMALVLSILATLYPSWRASRLDPVEALRYE